MIRKTVKVKGGKFQIRLPETCEEMGKLAADDYSVLRLIQVGIHQRQIQHIACLMKHGNRSHERIQEVMDSFKYKAHAVGGTIEV